VISLEFWTMVRYLLYPVLVVCGVAWAFFHFRLYRSSRCGNDAWSAWLGLAAALLGLAGIVGLTVARASGFSPVTSLMVTVGVIALALVLASGTVALWMDAWRRSRG
jgi:hypothetical protein